MERNANEDNATKNHTNNIRETTDVSYGDISYIDSTPINHHICIGCTRTLKSAAGLKRHQKACEKRLDSTAQTQSHVRSTSSSQQDTSCNNIIDETEKHINDAYEKMSVWRRNLFRLPKCKTGKEFIMEMTRLINSWCSKSPLRQYSLKALMVMPNLLLQQTSYKAKTSENKTTLERRLVLWKDGKIDQLIAECMVLQSRLEKSKSKPTDGDISNTFNKLMLQGRINAAIRLLSQTKNSGVLPLTQDTMQELHLKHPDAKPKYDDLLLQGPIKFLSPVIYDTINEDTTAKAAIITKGAAGMSSLNADDWRRIIGSNLFGNASSDLRKAIAKMTKQLCGEELNDPDSIEALLAGRLIPLSKNPGVRPIGIGEVLRRIIGKAVMSILRKDILVTSGNLQLCAGQKSVCEIAIHAAADLFDDDNNHGVLQIDAHNAFNSINRAVISHNMKILCPEFATFINNCYMKPARLFVMGGSEIQSLEGTTQGDPVAMAMYAIGILPLLLLQHGEITRIAFADDFTGVGTIQQMKSWWKTIEEHGPYIGYYPNASKSVLIVKEQHTALAKVYFQIAKLK